MIIVNFDHSKIVKLHEKATNQLRLLIKFNEQIVKLFSNEEFLKRYAFEGTYDAFADNALQNEIGE
jgi:hypothetical protein